MIDEGRLQERSAPGAVTVALGQAIDLVPYRAEIEAGHRPHHVLIDLADDTGGVVVTAHGARPSFLDRLCSLFLGVPSDWWVARQALARAGGGYVHANGEAIGVALLVLQWFRPSRSIRVGFWVMTPSGRRVWLWLKLLRLLRLRPLLVAESQVKAVAIRHVAGDKARVAILLPPMDLDFWRPGPAAPVLRSRPLLASSGLEKRDYRTLATAIESLDVDVVVCAVSPDARSSSALLPETMPPNLCFADFSLPELRGLFQAADLVVVPTRPNDIDAGGSSSMEAMSCGAAVVATDQGLFRNLADAGLVRVFPVGSPDGLRAVLSDLLAAPEEVAAMGRAARAQMVAHHDEWAWRVNLIEHVRRAGVPVVDLAPRPVGGRPQLSS